MPSKITLGTAQFGLNYGINNKTGQVSLNEMKNILELAKNNGIFFIDTAYLYGNSEARLGRTIEEGGTVFNIISKLPKCTSNEVRSYFIESLKRLNVKTIYSYLYHNFETFLNDKSSFDELLKLKKENKVKKIGFSLYSPNELEILFNENIQFDILQVPYNLLDRRFEPYFIELKKRGVEILIRSIFLQGLFFKDYNELSSKLLAFKNFLMKFNELAKDNGMHLDEIALGFAITNSLIDKVIVGIDNSDQLSRLIEIEKNIPKLEMFSKVNEIISRETIPEELLIPSNWN